MLDQRQFVGDLRPTQNRDKRPRGRRQQLSEIFDLPLHQQTCRLHGDDVRNADDGGVGPMRRAERIVDVDLGQPGQRLGEMRVVLLLFHMKPQIFE